MSFDLGGRLVDERADGTGANLPRPLTDPPSRRSVRAPQKDAPSDIRRGPQGEASRTACRSNTRLARDRADDLGDVAAVVLTAETKTPPEGGVKERPTP